MKIWRFKGDLSDSDTDWLKSIADEISVETEENKMYLYNSTRVFVCNDYYLTCRTSSEKQETLLLLKFGDRAYCTYDSSVFDFMLDMPSS